MTARAHRLAAHVWDACPGQRAESQLSRNSPAGVVGRDQTDPTAAKFGRQHQKLGPAPAVRHWRSCKILQVPTHPASNKILRIATDVVIIRRRLLMGGLQSEEQQLRVRSTSQVPRSRIGAGTYLYRLQVCRTQYPQRYVPAAGDGQIWALLTATRPRESTVPLSVTAAATVCSCPIFSRVRVPFQQHQLPSTPHSGTCMTEFRRQKAAFSIPDGQLTSA